MRKPVEALGLFAGALTTFAFVPQIIQVWRGRPVPASAVSFPMYVILSIGILCWLIYGGLIKSRPLIITNAFTLIFALAVLVYKCIYG